MFDIIVSFILDKGVDDSKIKIGVTDNRPGPGSGTDVDIYIELSVNGALFKELPLTPDFVISAGGSGDFLVPIPVVDGKYVTGQYKASLVLKEIATVVGQATEVHDYYPSIAGPGYESSIAALSATYSCADGIITLRDGSNHTGWTITGRGLTLLPPLVPGAPAPVAETSSLIEDQFSFSWEYAQYQAGFFANREKQDVQTGITFIEKEKVSGTKMLYVVCSIDSCAVAACFNEAYAKMNTTAASAGGWAMLSGNVLASYIKQLSATVGVLVNAGCNNYETVDSYIATLEACGCGCTASVIKTPKPFTP